MEVDLPFSTTDPEAALGIIDAPAGFATLGHGQRRQKVTMLAGFVADLRTRCVTPHIAAKAKVAIDARTIRHAGYAVSHRKR